MAVASISQHLSQQVRWERESVVARVQELREQSRRLHALTDQIDAELEESLRLQRGMDEMLGLAPQLSLDASDGELRGKRLREIAIEILRQSTFAEQTIHYRDWYQLVLAAGIRVAGKDPIATFLTQIARAEGVVSLGRRSGLYRLAA
jgi:hypothetical protein